MDPYACRVRPEEGDRAALGRTRFLTAASIVVAAFAFMITTVVWRLVQQTGAVETAVHESIAGMNRLGAVSRGEMAQLRERLAAVESTGRAGNERLESLAAGLARQVATAEQLGGEIERASKVVAQTRQEILERLAVDADRHATARDELVREVNDAIGRVERTLLAQAEDFQIQKRNLDAAAERDRAARRAMLQEATGAFAVQVEGLRQLLDNLRVEAAVVDGQAAVGGLEGEAAEAAPELTARPETEDGKPGGPDGEPATAAVGRGGLLE